MPFELERQSSYLVWLEEVSISSSGEIFLAHWAWLIIQPCSGQHKSLFLVPQTCKWPWENQKHMLFNSFFFYCLFSVLKAEEILVWQGHLGWVQQVCLLTKSSSLCLPKWLTLCNGFKATKSNRNNPCVRGGVVVFQVASCLPYLCQKREYKLPQWPFSDVCLCKPLFYG